MEVNNKNEVTIVDIRMPLGSMTTFMVKAILAAIPALIILGFIGVLFTAVFSGVMNA